MDPGARGARSQRPALPSKFQGGLQPCAGRLQGLPLQGRRALEGTGGSRCGRCDSERLSLPPALDDGVHRGRTLSGSFLSPDRSPTPGKGQCSPLGHTGTSNGTHGEARLPQGITLECQQGRGSGGGAGGLMPGPPHNRPWVCGSLKARGRWGRKGSGRDGPTWPITSSS